MNNKLFVKIYNSTKARMLSYVLYKVRSESIAEDIVSECYIKFLKELAKKPEIKDYALPWLYRVASNLVIDHFRSSYYKKTISEGSQNTGDDDSESWNKNMFIDEYEDNLDQLSKNEDQKKVLSGLDSLRDTDRQIIELRLYEELPFKDISVILESTEAAVKMKYKRAIEKLKVICNKDDEK